MITALVRVHMHKVLYSTSTSVRTLCAIRSVVNLPHETGEIDQLWGRGVPLVWLAVMVVPEAFSA